jgi:hypothetical protein
MSSARQSLNKHVPAATNMRATIDKLLEMVFSMQSMPKLYKEKLPRVESWEKYGSWVLWGPKPRMTVLAWPAAIYQPHRQG